MILVVGLGNPGRRYEDSRHNIGFRVVDRLARSQAEPPVWQERFDGLCMCTHVGREPAVLLKPQTFMNRSGESVRPALEHCGVTAERLLVIHDELDLPLGQLRLKAGGGEAGHKGLRSISGHIGTQSYQRLRMGIGRPPPDFSGSVADYVLENFSPDEAGQLAALVDRAADAVAIVAESGISAAMNLVNRKNI